jgi:hypothetical protein
VAKQSTGQAQKRRHRHIVSSVSGARLTEHQVLRRQVRKCTNSTEND